MSENVKIKLKIFTTPTLVKTPTND